MTSENSTLKGVLLRRGMSVAALALVGGAGWWGLGPVRLPEIGRSATATEDSPPADHVELAANWDVQAFRTPIWVAPPAPPVESIAESPTPPPSPPTPPRNMQLLAIVLKDGTYRAVIYDQDQDRLLTVSTGESVGGRTVAEIDEISITLGEGTMQNRLVLDPNRARARRSMNPSEGISP